MTTLRLGADIGSVPVTVEYGSLRSLDRRQSIGERALGTGPAGRARPSAFIKRRNPRAALIAAIGTARIRRSADRSPGLCRRAGIPVGDAAPMVRVMLPRIADDRPMMRFDAVDPVAIDANPVMVPIKAVPPPVRSKEADVGHRTPPEAGPDRWPEDEAGRREIVGRIVGIGPRAIDDRWIIDGNVDHVGIGGLERDRLILPGDGLLG